MKKMIYEGFQKWLDGVLDENMPLPGKGINFNLYEEEDSSWAIQIVSAADFDEDDSDWCCEEEFSSEENLFIWQEDAEWDEILEKSENMISQYLEKGKHAEGLKKYKGIAVGFVDGDLLTVYKQ